MSIRRALSTIPSKPGVIIAVIVAISVMSIYYFKQYKSCTDIASLRSSFYSVVQQNSNNIIRLAEVTPFQWERAKIILNYKNNSKVLDCQFGWDWTRKQRQQMMANDLLNVIVFAREGVNTVVDFSKEMVDFELTETIFTPASAVFRAKSYGADDSGYLLHQIR
jgi:hypothetical protein